MHTYRNCDICRAFVTLAYQGLLQEIQYLLTEPLRKAFDRAQESGAVTRGASSMTRLPEEKPPSLRYPYGVQRTAYRAGIRAGVPVWDRRRFALLSW